jgi:DNA mismatch repair ATPase MutS
MVYSEKLVKRYRELHEESLDCLLLMQVGAFMQVMDEDTPRGGNCHRLETANGWGC